MKYYVLLFAMTIFGSVASFFLKKASAIDGLKSLLMSYYIYVGGVLYFISALLNIVVLRYLDYSIVLPLTAITYIWTMFISSKMLGEKISFRKIIGTCAILIGAIFVAI